MWILVINLRRSDDFRRYIMGIPKPIRQRLLSESRTYRVLSTILGTYVHRLKRCVCPGSESIATQLPYTRALCTRFTMFAWWPYKMGVRSPLLANCGGNLPFISWFPWKGLVMRSFDISPDASLNMLLNKQSRCWWLKTLWCWTKYTISSIQPNATPLGIYALT